MKWMAIFCPGWDKRVFDLFSVRMVLLSVSRITLLVQIDASLKTKSHV